MYSGLRRFLRHCGSEVNTIALRAFHSTQPLNMAKGRTKSEPNSPGKNYGRYRVLSPLGQGAMASVFLAEDPALGRLVAIKVIHSHLAAQKDLLTRFTSEAKTAAALRSPNIVEVFDYGLEGASQYLVMEYIDGPTLQHVLNQHMGRPMDNALAACLMVQAAEGLMVAERRGVVHRDIKPENLMLASTGLLKIADFGIAHINEQNLTQTGSVLGSPSYMAPEQIDGKKPTHQTDMFALGSVFYVCLTGRKPFAGPNIPSIFRAICSLPHQPVAELNPDADSQLAEWAEQLLQKAPEERGEGAKALVGQLRQWLNQKGVFDPADFVQTHLAEAGDSVDHTLVESVSASAKPAAPLSTPSSLESATLDRGLAAVGEPVAGQTPGEKASGTTTPAMPKAVIGAMAAVIAILAGSLVALITTRHAKAKPKPAIVSRQDSSVVAPPIARPEAPKLAFVPDTLEMEEGTRRTLPLTGLPDSISPTRLIWTIQDSGIILRDTGWVTALKPGTTTVIASGEFGGASASARAHVLVTPAESKPPSSPNVPVGGTSPEVAPETEVPSKTHLTVLSAPPFAEVFVDGLYIGATPTKNKVIAAGKHRMLISHRRYVSIDTVMHFKPGTVKVKFHFSQLK